MIGPKLKIISECDKCEFKYFHYHNNHYLCNKLNVVLSRTRTEEIIPNENCPFLEENAIKFHTESITQISKTKDTKTKETLKSIFNKDSEVSIKTNEIFITSESITCSMIDKVKLHFPDHDMEFSVADNYNVCLSLTKKIA